MSAASDRPIDRQSAVDQLMAHFRAGEKRPDQLRIGLEHEKIGVLGDGRAPGYDLIAQLLERMAARGWSRVEEQGRLIALEHPTSGSVTLEPGGQVEHSGAPWPSAAAAARENDQHLDELTPIAEELGITFLGVGFRPFGTLEDVPWMPKRRYHIMREYLQTRGKRGHEMMKRTATVQANLDYVDEADALEKLRLGQALSSLVTALFAASPLVDGRPSGYQSYRAAAWLDTDPDRCGLLRFVFEEGAGFRQYAEWALDVPMFSVHRGGGYRPAQGMTFRRFIEEGFSGERPTLRDWELHLSTLFPEVRLKQYVEVRQADAGPRELVRALPALWRGVLYDRESRQRSWSLVGDLSWEERLTLYRETPRSGLKTSLRGRSLSGMCRELVAAARDGLLRLNAVDGAALLAPLDQILDEGRSVADRIVAEHARCGGDPARLIPALALG